MTSYRKVAVIPAYEPGKLFLPILERTADLGFWIVVVDDGSGKSYEETFLQAESYAHVISYPNNRGKGHAIRMAFSYLNQKLTESDEQAVIAMMSCNDQHAPEDALRLCQAAAADPGSLYLENCSPPEDMSLFERLGYSLVRFVSQAVSEENDYNAQTRLRAFSSDMLPKMLEISGDRYEYEKNMLTYFTTKSPGRISA